MLLQKLKASTQYTGKKCSVCKSTVKVGETAYCVAGATGYYRSNTARVWHRDCLAYFVNESQGLLTTCSEIASMADHAESIGQGDRAEGIRQALDKMLTVINEKRALTVKETQAERIEREFKELQAQLVAQHAPKATKATKATKKRP